MILLLGASGYVGQAFTAELRRRRCDFIPLARKVVDYAQFDALFDYVRKTRPAFVINAAGFPGKPNVDACELARGETLCANTILPQTIARVCLMRGTPWGHVSSGSIFRGAKVEEDGRLLVERDLNEPELRRLLAERPDRIRGFTELDEPNFSFLCPPCNFYSGSKAAAEQAIQGVGRCYIWRPGIPFNEQDHPRNLLSKLQRYEKVYDGVNSVSHLQDFVQACLDLWEGGAAFGCYNITNPGVVETRQIVRMIQRILKPGRNFEFWKNDKEFYRFGARAPRSSAILDSSKALVAGVRLRPAIEALEDSLHDWHRASPDFEFVESCSAAGGRVAYQAL